MPDSRILRLIVSLTAAGTVVAVGLTLAGFAARWGWRFEQVCHFRVQYFWLLVLAAAVLFAAKRRRLGAVAMGAAILNLSAILPIYWPTPAVSANGCQLRILSFNVLSQNDRHDEVLAYLRAQQADIVLLMEVSPAWAVSIEELSDLYPHRHVVARDDNFGIALLSRIPWQEESTVELGSSSVPTIVAKFNVEQRRLLLVGTHPLPPGSPRMAALRNEQLLDVAEYVRQDSAEEAAVVVVGDLNTTEFSPFFGDLLATTNLRDSRQGRGIQASWQALPLLEIPLDHCLVSSQIAVVQRRVGPHLGSDHRPVIVDLRLPAATSRPRETSNVQNEF